MSLPPRDDAQTNEGDGTCSCCSASRRAADASLLEGRLTALRWRRTSASEDAMNACGCVTESTNSRAVAITEV